MASGKHFAAYPSAYVYAKPEGTIDKPKGDVLAHLLWGQYVKVLDGPGSQKNGFQKVQIRKKIQGWMVPGTFQKERILEVVFVDIGQGDGCLLVTPDDEHFVIDAGLGDNMYRFLAWRYKFRKQQDPVEFTGVISHPDSDHYGGFDAFFDDPKVRFKRFYHNGILERQGSSSNQLGTKARHGRRSYLTDLVRNRADLDAFLNSDLWRAPPNTRKRDKMYPAMLDKGRQNGSFGDFDMLDVTTNGGFVPGYEADETLSMQILGPVAEDIGHALPGLRWLGDKGKTKNGHSVVFKVVYGDVSILLGGDLNIPSEQLLLQHHTGLDIPSESKPKKYTAFLDEARKTFQVDVAKSCHHGSADFYRPYLAATYPLVTVISSGDAESHSHPRADTLGTVGKYSRGVRSLMFNTELARSSGERVEIPLQIRRKLDALAVEISTFKARLKATDLTPTEKDNLKEKVRALETEQERHWKKLARSVDVYGAINLRTDGKRIVMAQKLEKKRGNDVWDIYQIEKGADGEFRYLSKYEDH